MIPQTTLISQSDRTAARSVGGRAVVVGIDSQRVNTLNPVGTRVWELADGRSLGDIARCISEEFEVDEDTALADAQGFVEKMVGLGLLVVQKEEP